MFSCKVLFKCVVFEAPDASEEINLPRKNTQVNAIIIADIALSGSGKVNWHPLSIHGANRIECRKKFGTLDPVNGPCPFYIQDSYPQITIIFQSHGDDLLKAPVGEVFLPTLFCNFWGFGCGFIFFVCHAFRPFRWDRRCRTRVSGGH